MKYHTFICIAIIGLFFGFFFFYLFNVFFGFCFFFIFTYVCVSVWKGVQVQTPTEARGGCTIPEAVLQIALSHLTGALETELCFVGRASSILISLPLLEVF